MAKFNEILVGRFNRYIQKLTQVKGEPPSAQIAGEMTPGFDLNSVYPEDRYLLSYDTYAQGLGLGPTAAVVNVVRLRNPPGSNVIGRLVKNNVSSGAADQINFTYATGQTTDLASPLGAVANLDPRSGRANTLIVSVTTNATQLSLANLLDKQTLNATTVYTGILERDQAIPLLPGAAVQWTQTTVNALFCLAFMWTERFLEESERA